jgi:putative transposase
LDLFFLDECGFSPTQPTGHTWSLPGRRYIVPFENPRGRRVNALVAMRAPHPEPKLRFTVKPRTLTAADLLAFLRSLPSGTRPCVVVLDNGSIHVSRVIRNAAGDLRRRQVHLFYLPPYAPELNDLEHLLGVLKQHELPARSYPTVPGLMAAVRAGLRACRKYLRSM